MIKRIFERRLRALLRQSSSVAVLGPRQVGKTTLAKSLKRVGKRDTVYLDMENPMQRSMLSLDPYSYLDKLENKTVIVDEVQQVPEIYTLLRPLIDKKRIPGRFILLGSCSPHLVKGVSESLAGRIAFLDLPEINLCEALKQHIGMEKHWFRGGFPNALLAKNDAIWFRWTQDFLRSYTERDFSHLFGMAFPYITIYNFLAMLAANNGQIWNAESYGRSLGLTGATVTRYLSFLEGAFLITRLYPWFINIRKRIIKSPKVYFRNSGMVHFFNSVASVEMITQNPIVGASWEGYVVEQLRQLKSELCGMYFYRTHHGAETDILLVKGTSPLSCIEIKYSNAPSIPKGFHECIRDMNTVNNFIITPGSEEYPAGNGITVCNLERFLKYHLPRIK